jgi:hypothetical protein
MVAISRTLMLVCLVVGVQAHSCYWYVVHVDGCKPGTSEKAVDACLKCAAAHPDINSTVCSPTELNATCHGILPPTPPTPPTPGPAPSPSDLKLTLLHDAAVNKGAICLDGSE